MKEITAKELRTLIKAREEELHTEKVQHATEWVNSLTQTLTERAERGLTSATVYPPNDICVNEASKILEARGFEVMKNSSKDLILFW